MLKRCVLDAAVPIERGALTSLIRWSAAQDDVAAQPKQIRAAPPPPSAHVAAA